MSSSSRPVRAATRKDCQSVASRGEETFRHLIDDLPDAVLVHRDGEVLFVNPACVRLLAADNPQQLLGRHISQIIHPDYLPEVERRILDRRLSRTASTPFEHVVVALNGTHIDVEAVAIPCTWRGSAAVEVVIRDIRERKLAQQKDREWQKRLELAQQAGLRIGMWEWDLASQTAVWSEETYRQFDISPDIKPVPVAAALDKIHPEDLPAVRRAIQKVLDGGTEYAAQYRIVRSDGSFNWIDAHGVTIRNGSDHMLGIGIDITERKMLERQFWQSQKLEAVGRLAGGVAHDFNNALMIVSSYADLILQMNLEHPKLNDYTRKIYEAAMKAANVTQQLLAFSHKQMLEPEILDPNQVVKDLKKILAKLLGEDVAIVTNFDPAVHRVKADRGQLEQIVLNLAVNARDAMPKGGRLVIETRNATIDSKFVPDPASSSSASYVMLSVSDNGIGMDAETKARVFEPFFTTKQGDGSGLGLATVYGIVKQSGGFIWLNSEVGKGTTFEIYLPETSQSAAKPNPAEFTGGSETILLVEDEAGLRNAACEFLLARGYNILPAASGEEALEIIGQWRTPIHAVLTDLIMPGMDGVELGKAIQSKHPEVRVLYMSGYHDRAIEGLRAGAILLRKPCTLQTIANKLREALDSPSLHPLPSQTSLTF